MILEQWYKIEFHHSTSSLFSAFSILHYLCGIEVPYQVGKRPLANKSLRHCYEPLNLISRQKAASKKSVLELRDIYVAAEQASLAWLLMY